MIFLQLFLLLNSLASLFHPILALFMFKIQTHINTTPEGQNNYTKSIIELWQFFYSKKVDIGFELNTQQYSRIFFLHYI